MTDLDTYDLQLIEATQSGLPITEAPYECIGAQIGLSEEEVIARLGRLMDTGVIRRIAAATNHFELGMTANGMTVWDIDDTVSTAKGAEVGALRYVSHCYLRPRVLPDWPYNLFAMVHGSSRSEVETKRAEIRTMLGPSCHASDILYSKRILKKTGVRLS